MARSGMRCYATLSDVKEGHVRLTWDRSGIAPPCLPKHQLAADTAKTGKGREPSFCKARDMAGKQSEAWGADCDKDSFWWG